MNQKESEQDEVDGMKKATVVCLVDGISLWLVRWSGTRYLTFYVILTSAETASKVCPI